MANNIYIYVSGQFLFYDCLSAYCNFLLFHNFNPQKVVSFFIDDKEEEKKNESATFFLCKGSSLVVVVVFFSFSHRVRK